MASRKVQILCVAKEFLRPGESKIVQKADITPEQWKWNGKLIRIRELRDGKCQVMYSI